MLKILLFIVCTCIAPHEIQKIEHVLVQLTRSDLRQSFVFCGHIFWISRPCLVKKIFFGGNFLGFSKNWDPHSYLGSNFSYHRVDVPYVYCDNFFHMYILMRSIRSLYIFTDKKKGWHKSHWCFVECPPPQKKEKKEKHSFWKSHHPPTHPTHLHKELFQTPSWTISINDVGCFSCPPHCLRNELTHST